MQALLGAIPVGARAGPVIRAPFRKAQFAQSIPLILIECEPKSAPLTVTLDPSEKKAVDTGWLRPVAVNAFSAYGLVSPGFAGARASRGTAKIAFPTGAQGTSELPGAPIGFRSISLYGIDPVSSA